MSLVRSAEPEGLGGYVTDLPGTGLCWTSHGVHTLLVSYKIIVVPCLEVAHITD